MKRSATLFVALATSLVAAGCADAPTSAAPPTATPATAKAPAPTSFTFTNAPATLADQAITSPANGLQAMLFRVDAISAAGLTVKQLGFMISGSLQAGDVGNYQLVYYPKGPGKPGILSGTNTGANWVAPGGDPTSFITFDLATPITIPKDKPFTAWFGLFADVTGTGTFFFYPSAQTALVNNGVIDQDVTWFGGDLPLRGTVFHVN